MLVSGRVIDDIRSHLIENLLDTSAVTHVGMDARAETPDVEALYRELAELVEKEDYEKASVIKRKIKRLMGDGDD